MLKFLGVTIETAEADRVVLAMEVTPKVHQYIGIMNGGVSLFLCETAASIGAVLNADLTKVSPVGVEINANHLRAVSRGSSVLKQGRYIRAKLWQCGQSKSLMTGANSSVSLAAHLC